MKYMADPIATPIIASLNASMNSSHSTCPIPRYHSTRNIASEDSVYFAMLVSGSLNSISLLSFVRKISMSVASKIALIDIHAETMIVGSLVIVDI